MTDKEDGIIARFPMPNRNCPIEGRAFGGDACSDGFVYAISKRGCIQPDNLALMDAAARDTSLPYDEWSEANRAFKEALAEAYRTGQIVDPLVEAMELHNELKDNMAGHNLPPDPGYAHLLPHDLCHRILAYLAADRVTRLRRSAALSKLAAGDADLIGGCDAD